MAKKRDVSRGVAEVALMALSKRQFFQRLLEDPDGTLEDVRSDLGLSQDDVDDVKALVAEGLRDLEPADVLTSWDDWRSTGRWGGDRGWITFGWITSDET